MTLAAVKEHGVSYSVSDEARERIVDARVRDLAFHIRRIIPVDSLNSADAEALASVVVQGMDEGARVDREFVATRLQKAGRSKDKALALSSALFK